MVLASVALALPGLLTGCDEGGSLDVPIGTFVAETEGAVTDTLRGSAHYRTQEEDLIGFELGAQTSPGMSIEVEPAPPEPRTYRVLEERLFRLDRDSHTLGGIVFLSVDDQHFEATAGTLKVQQVNRSTVDATFSFEMNGHVDATTEERSILVTGRFRATPVRE